MKWIWVATMALAVSPMYGQFGGFGGSSTRRASIRGGGGDSGKCTIEVRVDDVAEVEIRGDTGRIHTLSGQPAQWVRFECTSPLPRNPVDFRFRGIDGRGRVNLIRDPNQTSGAAVVRIEDNKGGSEGYTFDLEWRGQSGSYGYGNDRYGRDDRYGRNDRYGRDDRYNRDDRYSRNSNTFVLSCSSDDGRRNYCNTDTRGGVRLVRQRSDARCSEGYSWGYDRRGIWVDRGCRADFEVGR